MKNQKTVFKVVYCPKVKGSKTMPVSADNGTKIIEFLKH